MLDLGWQVWAAIGVLVVVSFTVGGGCWVWEVRSEARRTRVLRHEHRAHPECRFTLTVPPAGRSWQAVVRMQVRSPRTGRFRSHRSTDGTFLYRGARETSIRLSDLPFDTAVDNAVQNLIAEEERLIAVRKEHVDAERRAQEEVDRQMKQRDAQMSAYLDRLAS